MEPVIIVWFPATALSMLASTPEQRETLRIELCRLWGLDPDSEVMGMDAKSWVDNGWLLTEHDGVGGYAYIITAIQAGGHDAPENIARWRQMVEAYGGHVWTDVRDWRDVGLEVAYG
jgi:hypothetical protein